MFDYDKTLKKLGKFQDLSNKKQSKVLNSIFFIEKATKKLHLVPSDFNKLYILHYYTTLSYFVNTFWKNYSFFFAKPHKKTPRQERLILG